MTHDKIAHQQNSKDAWESYASDGWEKNGGRRQTNLFASYFLEHTKLPTDASTLLDVGCALGDAAVEFKRHYPHLQITGCDISETFIQNAREHYGNLARFEQWSFDEITGDFDVIYCSNTLEHFTNYVEIAEKLLNHCRHLYILVPYMELNEGKRLNADSEGWHVSTFDENSFDNLIKENKAASIQHSVIYTPGAWGKGPVTLYVKLRAWLRKVPVPTEYRQIIFSIARAA